MRYIFLSVFLLLISCGGSDDGYKDKKRTPNSPEFSQKVEPLLTKYCAKCHASSAFISSEGAFKSGQPAERLSNRSMPQSGSEQAKNLSEADRSYLIAFAKK